MSLLCTKTVPGPLSDCWIHDLVTSFKGKYDKCLEVLLVFQSIVYGTYQLTCHSVVCRYTACMCLFPICSKWKYWRWCSWLTSGFWSTPGTHHFCSQCWRDLESGFGCYVHWYSDVFVRRAIIYCMLMCTWINPSLWTLFLVQFPNGTVQLLCTYTIHWVQLLFTQVCSPDQRWLLLRSDECATLPCWDWGRLSITVMG